MWDTATIATNTNDKLWWDGGEESGERRELNLLSKYHVYPNNG